MLNVAVKAGIPLIIAKDILTFELFEILTTLYNFDVEDVRLVLFDMLHCERLIAPTSIKFVFESIPDISFGILEFLEDKDDKSAGPLPRSETIEELGISTCMLERFASFVAFRFFANELVMTVGLISIQFWG